MLDATEDQLAATLDAIETTSVERLILVGDPRQLPPIGAGRPFVDIVRYLNGDDANIAEKAPPGYAELKLCAVRPSSRLLQDSRRRRATTSSCRDGSGAKLQIPVQMKRGIVWQAGNQSAFEQFAGKMMPIFRRSSCSDKGGDAGYLARARFRRGAGRRLLRDQPWRPSVQRRRVLQPISSLERCPRR